MISYCPSKVKAESGTCSLDFLSVVLERWTIYISLFARELAEHGGNVSGSIVTDETGTSSTDCLSCLICAAS